MCDKQTDNSSDAHCYLLQSILIVINWRPNSNNLSDKNTDNSSDTHCYLIQRILIVINWGLTVTLCPIRILIIVVISTSEHTDSNQLTNNSNNVSYQNTDKSSYTHCYLRQSILIIINWLRLTVTMCPIRILIIVVILILQSILKVINWRLTVTICVIRILIIVVILIAIYFRAYW